MHQCHIPCYGQCAILPEVLLGHTRQAISWWWYIPDRQLGCTNVRYLQFYLFVSLLLFFLDHKWIIFVTSVLFHNICWYSKLFCVLLPSPVWFSICPDVIYVCFMSFVSQEWKLGLMRYLTSIWTNGVQECYCFWCIWDPWRSPCITFTLKQQTLFDLVLREDIQSCFCGSAPTQMCWDGATRVWLNLPSTALLRTF